MRAFAMTHKLIQLNVSNDITLTFVVKIADIEISFELILNF